MLNYAQFILLVLLFLTFYNIYTVYVYFEWDVIVTVKRIFCTCMDWEKRASCCVTFRNTNEVFLELLHVTFVIDGLG